MLFKVAYKTIADADGWECPLGEYPTADEALAAFNSVEANKYGAKLRFDDNAPHISDYQLWVNPVSGGGIYGISLYPEIDPTQK